VEPIDLVRFVRGVGYPPRVLDSRNGEHRLS